ncbi:MAG: transporter [Thiolinea sp.]
MQLKQLCISVFIFSGIFSESALAASTEGIVSLTNAEVAEREKEKNQQQATQNAYIDQLIDASVAEDLPPEELESISERQQAEGNLRTVFLSSEFRHMDNGQQSDNRIDLNMQAYWQTIGFGDFTLITKAAEYHENLLTDDVVTQFSDYHLTLQQDGWIVSEDWTMHNTLGVNHNFQNSLISNSSQVSLTPQIFQGWSSYLQSEDTEIRFMAGEKGGLSAVSGFEAGDEKVFGLGVAHHVNDNWTVGSQAWRVEGEGIGAELEYSAFMRHREQGGKYNFKLQALNAKGNTGIWIDGETASNRFRHQWGGYQLAKEVQWMGEVLGGQGKGAYWRTAYSHPRYNSHSSFDWQENDRERRISVRQSLNYKWNKATQLGAAASYLSFDNQQSDGGQFYVSAYTAKRFASGHSNRFQLSAKDANSSNNEDKGREYELNYSHQWLLPAANDVGVQFLGRHYDLSTSDYNAYRLGASWRREFTDGNYLGANINLGSSDQNKTQRQTVNYRFAGSYQLSSQWAIEGGLEYDQHDDDTESEFSVNATLSYNGSWGKALNKASRRSGTIRGVVFYDTNGDGKKQPLEKAASGIGVVLDQRNVPETTNSNGEFEFALVGAGEHQLGIREETVPLPWELAERATEKITVKIRQTQYVYLPLVSLDNLD